MKKLLLVIIIPFLSFGQDLTYIPDDTFEQALIDLGYDDVLDNYVSTSMILLITELDLNWLGIDDLTGIEDFTNLTSLEVGNNNLTELNLANNLELIVLFCPANPLTELDVSNNLQLELLQCGATGITELDVSNNIQLNWLFCSGSPLTALDLSNNTNLETLYCASTNIFPTLDVSNNTSLTRLVATSNNLVCIKVWDVEFAENQSTTSCYVNEFAPNVPCFEKDSWASWSLYCEFIYGCTDPGACNYDITVNWDNGTCEYLSCVGCTDVFACNYEEDNTISDDSCVYPLVYYLDCDNNCLNDYDGDEFCDEIDNCPYTYNISQLDSDFDSIGDACDDCDFDADNDIDGDEICGDVDNCIGDYNPGQDDSDNDGIGDDCDSTPLSIEEALKTKKLVKIVDALGRETTNKGFQLHIYDDGSVEKKYLIK